MSKDFWSSWPDQPLLEVVLIWLAVLAAFLVALWQVGPTLAGADNLYDDSDDRSRPVVVVEWRKN